MRRGLKTITLLDSGESPIWVICPGHVTAKEFNDAFKSEGWNERGGYKQKDLRFEYWVKTKPKRKGQFDFKFKQSLPGKLNAKPYTVVGWD